MDEKKDPEPTGGEVVSIEDARKRSEERSAADGGGGRRRHRQREGSPSWRRSRELAVWAGPDGTIKIDGMTDDEATKAKTQALLRGLGQGLGDVLAQALSKWGSKIDLKFNVAPAGDSPTGPPAIQPTPIRSEPPAAPAGAPAGAPGAPPGAEDPTKKNS